MKETEADLLNWHFLFTEGGLAKSEEIESITEECKLFRAPTIIFNNNQLIAEDKEGRIRIVYNAKEALKFINFETRQKHYCGPEDKGTINTISHIPVKLHVKDAAHWKQLEKPKNIEITELHEISDSFFLNTFKGHVEGEVKVEKVKESVIPVQKLGPGNPITFYQQGSIYEDQLDDNGLIQYEYKFRTMANSWFALIRNYARVDSVSFIIYDTRLYWEAGWKMVARQFMVRSCTWEQFKTNEAELPPGWRMNPNQSHLLYPYLKEELIENEYIHYG